MFEKLMPDRLTLIKNGAVIKEGIEASVQANKIITFEASLQFQKNDILLRELENGLIERFVITDLQFKKGVGNIKSSYEIFVDKQDLN